MNLCPACRKLQATAPDARPWLRALARHLLAELQNDEKTATAISQAGIRLEQALTSVWWTGFNGDVGHPDYYDDDVIRRRDAILRAQIDETLPAVRERVARQAQPSPELTRALKTPLKEGK